LLLSTNGVQYVSRLGYVRQVNFGSNLVPFGTARTRGLGSRSLGGVAALEIGTDLDCFMLFNGTGMRFLLGHADQRQYIENRFAFDFQLPS
jgi:hypothetical protein